LEQRFRILPALEASVRAILARLLRTPPAAVVRRCTIPDRAVLAVAPPRATDVQQSI